MALGRSSEPGYLRAMPSEVFVARAASCCQVMNHVLHSAGEVR